MRNEQQPTIKATHYIMSKQESLNNETKVITK